MNEENCDITRTSLIGAKIHLAIGKDIKKTWKKISDNSVSGWIANL